MNPILIALLTISIPASLAKSDNNFSTKYHGLDKANEELENPMRLYRHMSSSAQENNDQEVADDVVQITTGYMKFFSEQFRTNDKQSDMRLLVNFNAVEVSSDSSGTRVIPNKLVPNYEALKQKYQFGQGNLTVPEHEIMYEYLGRLANAYKEELSPEYDNIQLIPLVKYTKIYNNFGDTALYFGIAVVQKSDGGLTGLGAAVTAEIVINNYQ